MQLSRQDIKRFKAIGHHLDPVVTVAGRGLDDGVVAELERAIGDHELIKIKLVTPDREARRALIETITERTQTTLVQMTGNKALIYRPAKQPNARLSNVLRSDIF